MGEAIERLRELVAEDAPVALSMRDVLVRRHTRHTKSGKVVDVESYTRSLAKMSMRALSHELVAARSDRAKYAQVTNEIRRRNTVSRALSNPGTPEGAAERARGLSDGELERHLKQGIDHPERRDPVMYAALENEFTRRASESLAQVPPAAHATAASRWAAMSDFERREVVTALQRDTDPKILQFDRGSLKAAYSVGADRALLERLGSGEPLTEDEYRALLIRHYALAA